MGGDGSAVGGGADQFPANTANHRKPRFKFDTWRDSITAAVRIVCIRFWPCYAVRGRHEHLPKAKQVFLIYNAPLIYSQQKISTGRFVP